MKDPHSLSGTNVPTALLARKYCEQGMKRITIP